MAITQEQLENVQIDYGMLYSNYGEADSKMLGPTRGGGEFKATADMRSIEFDGQKGATMGTDVVEAINAILSVVTLDTSMASLALAMPWATYDDVAGTLTCEAASIGVVPTTSYLKNVTMFAKTVKGEYRKITLYNAMSKKEFVLAAKPKGEGEIGLEISAHWDPTDGLSSLFLVETVLSIDGDSIAPTATTVPADAATAIVVTEDLTATFSEPIKPTDVNSDNFILVKAADGTIVPGTLVYSAVTKVVTFDPTAGLEAATPYIWSITNVRDLTGNKVLPTITDFTTA